MNRVRLLAATFLSSALLLLVSVGSRMPWQTGERERGVVRLSWRMRPEHIEHCRDRTQTELGALPVHMRTPRICETRAVPYRLIVMIDGAIADTAIVLPGGAKHDRPLYVFRDWSLVPGRHHVSVTFGRNDGNSDTVLRFDRELRVFRGKIELITLADDASRLALVGTQQ